MVMLGGPLRRIAQSPDHSRSSRLAPCSNNIVISEQRFDLPAPFPWIGGKTCLLMEDHAHLPVNTTGLGETFRKEP